MLTSTFTAGTDAVVIMGTLDASLVVLSGFTVDATIPEPSSLALAALGLLGLMGIRRRRSR